MPATFTKAPQVEAIAKRLIPEHHRNLDREGVHFEYLFASEIPDKAGKRVIAKVQKIGSLQAFLAGQEPMDKIDEAQGMKPLFVMVVNKDAWEMLKPAQWEAVIDHELCHCDAYYDSKGILRLTLHGHDIEEFRAVVSRHGMYLEDIQRFVEAAGQMSFRLGTDR